MPLQAAMVALWREARLEKPYSSIVLSSRAAEEVGSARLSRHATRTLASNLGTGLGESRALLGEGGFAAGVHASWLADTGLLDGCLQAVVLGEDSALDRLLSSSPKLSHLAALDGLRTLGLAGCVDVYETQGRAAFLTACKECGVASLPERQSLANAIAREAAARRCSAAADRP